MKEHMKPRNVYVSVVQMGDDEQYVNVVFRLHGAKWLEKENMPTAKGGLDPEHFRVNEVSRRRRQKQIQQIIEAVEFDNDQ
jgi:hypothetical protein